MTKEERRRWVLFAKDHKHRFVLIILTEWDNDHFPVYCTNYTDLVEFYKHYSGKEGFDVVEVFDITANIGKQLAMEKCWSLPKEIQSL